MSDQRSARFFPPANQGLLIAAMAAMMVMTLLGPLMVFSDLPMAGEGNPVRQAIYAAILIATVAGVRPQDWRRLVAVPVPIVVALGWCWLSVFWSIDPGISVRRLVLTMLVIWTIFIGVRQIGSSATINIVTAALIGALFANYVAVLLFPEFGIHQVNSDAGDDLIGDWRGIMMHKNFAGATTAVLIPFLCFGARRIPLSLRVLIGIAATVFLFFSQSKTSLGLVGIGVLAGFAYLRLSPRLRIVAVPALILAGVAAITIYNTYKDPMALVLRDPTAFTGRTVIWRALLAYAQDHPWTGTGFGAFWNIGPASPIYTYGAKWITGLASGHNGFLDLVVTIGLPGLALVLFATVIWPIATLFLSRRIAPRGGALVIALIVFCIAHNGTESSLFDRDSIVQVVLIFALAMLVVLRAEGAAEERRANSPFAALGMRSALT